MGAAILAVAGLGVLASGCDDPAAPAPVPTSVQAVAGDGQTGTVGTPVPIAPSIRVLDQNGRPMADVTVRFGVAAGGGSVAKPEGTTNEAGVASPGSWTLGTRAGPNTLAVSVGQAVGALTATAAAGAPAAMSAQAGDGQSATVGSAVEIAPAVRVEDRYGNPVAGLAVTFAETASPPGDGARGSVIAGADAITDADGVATAGSWTLGTTLGSYEISASAQGLEPAVFTASALAGAGAAVEKAAGDGQSARVLTAVSVAPAVRVTDAFGNPVAGAAVTFEVTAGGGVVEGAFPRTAADGVAAVGSWTVGPAPGDNALTARAEGIGAVTFTAAARPAVPATITVVRGADQAATVGTAVREEPAVRVDDEDGVPIPGVEVTFGVASGGGTITGARVVTDGGGEAAVGSWTLGTTAGENALAVAAGPASATIRATGRPGAPVSMKAVAGDSQSVATGTTVPIRPTVRIEDFHGNGVPDVPVTFAVETGGGTVTGGSATTSPDGVAAPAGWTLGPNRGANTLTTTAASLPPVTFTATATAPEGDGSFDIQVVVLGTMTDEQLAAFTAAAARWQEVITGDVPDHTSTLPANGCQPQDIGYVDDLVIFARIDSIDGQGGILGQAGPCNFRAGGPPFPVTGRMTFDSADVASLQERGTFGDVILHEMGHVLGIGTLWSVGQNHLLADAGGADPHFTGPGAIAAFDNAGGAGRTGPKVPVENMGGPGTRDAHWRESVHGNELMTGWLGTAGNPLSAITVASLQDMGYSVDISAADPYAIPQPNAALRAPGSEGFELRELPLGPPIPLPPSASR